MMVCPGKGTICYDIKVMHVVKQYACFLNQTQGGLKSYLVADRYKSFDLHLRIRSVKVSRHKYEPLKDAME